MSDTSKKKKNPVWRVVKIILLAILLLLLALALTVYLYLHSKFKLMQEDNWTAAETPEISGELDETEGTEGAEPGSGAADETGESGNESGESTENSAAAGENVDEQPSQSGNSGNTQGGNTGGSGNSDTTQAETMDPAYADLESKDAVEATGEVKVDKQVFNILLIGSDEDTDSYSSASRSDSCLLLSINTTGDKPVISLVSFQRDMAVLVQEGKHAGTWDKLNHTFQYGGAEQLMRQIEYSFKVDVDYYVRVNFNVFKKGIDYIGGVDVYMDEKEVTYFHDGHISPDVFVGVNRLNGQLALAYARLREIDSDWSRIQRQREVIIAALNQAKGMTFGEIDTMINTLLPMVRTNLSEWKVAQLMLLIPSILQADVQQLSIPVSGTYGLMPNTKLWMLSVDFAKNAEVLHEFLYGE